MKAFTFIGLQYCLNYAVYGWWLIIEMFFSGQVLTRQNIEDIIKFAARHNLFVLADEVSNKACTYVCIPEYLKGRI